MAPAITLFLPFRILTGGHLVEKQAALVFFFGKVLLQSWLLRAVDAYNHPRTRLFSLDDVPSHLLLSGLMALTGPPPWLEQVECQSLRHVSPVIPRASRLRP